MKVAITGAAGLMGHGLVQVFKARHEVFPLPRAEADITKFDDVRAILTKLKPNVVVHSAAIPDLDLCESDPAKAQAVNVDGTRHVVEAARLIGAEVAQISTDAVFDGKKQTPYNESDPPNPPTVYGRTKLQAEGIVQESPNHWIFRVSVLFGPGKTNFIKKGLDKIALGEDYVVASDQLGSATYTVDAAGKIMEVVEARRYGLYHLSNEGPCTRLELALLAVELAGLDKRRVVGKPDALMGRRAQRLKYAVMDMAALKGAGFALLRPWREAVAEYVGTLDLSRHRAL